MLAKAREKLVPGKRQVDMNLFAGGVEQIRPLPLIALPPLNLKENQPLTGGVDSLYVETRLLIAVIPLEPEATLRYFRRSAMIFPFSASKHREVV